MRDVFSAAITIYKVCLIESLDGIGYRTKKKAVLLEMMIGIGIDIRMLKYIVIGIPQSDD